MKVQLFTPDDLRAMAREEIAKAGSQKAWAEKHGISIPQLCEVLKGRREPSDALAAAFGLTAVRRFVKRG